MEINQVGIQEGTGSLLIVSLPSGAEVHLDGEHIIRAGEHAVTPVLVTNVPAGQHNLTLTLPGYIDQTINVTLADGGYLKITIDLYHTAQTYQNNIGYQTLAYIERVR